MTTQHFFILLMIISSFLLGTNAKAQNATGAEPTTLEQALKLAPETGKKILVDVYATWCPYCKRMHSEVYPSDEVRQAISDHFLLVKIDVEGTEEVNYFGEVMTEAEFARALENQNVPTTYFLNDEGAILGVQPGYLEPDVFSSLLQFVGSDAYLNQTFSEFNQSE
jgi:thioredoxin-related protein